MHKEAVHLLNFNTCNNYKHRKNFPVIAITTLEPIVYMWSCPCIYGQDIFQTTPEYGMLHTSSKPGHENVDGPAGFITLNSASLKSLLILKTMPIHHCLLYIKFLEHIFLLE